MNQKCLIWVFFHQKCLIWVFWGRISKNYCHTWNQHPQISLLAKFCEKTKMPKFGTKTSLFGYFWGRISKNYCHIWNQHPQICQKWVFNANSEFQYRVRFFWRSGSGSALESMPINQKKIIKSNHFHVE